MVLLLMNYLNKKWFLVKEKVLEIGSNIGRNSLIAYILGKKIILNL